jgi:hypothetical protein
MNDFCETALKIQGEQLISQRRIRPLLAQQAKK